MNIYLTFRVTSDPTFETNVFWINACPLDSSSGRGGDNPVFGKITQYDSEWCVLFFYDGYPHRQLASIEIRGESNSAYARCWGIIV